MLWHFLVHCKRKKNKKRYPFKDEKKDDDFLIFLPNGRLEF